MTRFGSGSQSLENPSRRGPGCRGVGVSHLLLLNDTDSPEAGRRHRQVSRDAAAALRRRHLVHRPPRLACLCSNGHPLWMRRRVGSDVRQSIRSRQGVVLRRVHGRRAAAPKCTGCRGIGVSYLVLLNHADAPEAGRRHRQVSRDAAAALRRRHLVHRPPPRACLRSDGQPLWVRRRGDTDVRQSILSRQGSRAATSATAGAQRSAAH